MNLMKNYLYGFIPLILLITILLAAPLVGAQTGAAETSEYENIFDYFATIPGLAALGLIVTQFIKRFKWKFLDGIFSVALSWGITFILSAIGYLLQRGIFVGVEWYYIFVYGLAASLIANAAFDWKVIKAILEFAKLLPTNNTGRTVLKK